MRNTWAVFKREFIGYFITPIGYVFTGMFALVSGLAFTSSFLFFALVTQGPSKYGYTGIPKFEETMLSPFLVFCGMLIMFIGPLLTMRLLAEERNRGTMELLLTYPLRTSEIVFGKYFAALGLLAPVILVIGVYLSLMAYFVPVESVGLIFGLLAVILMGMAFISMGLFVSSIARNQITAGTMTFGIWFVSYVFGSLGKDLPAKIPAPEAWSQNVKTALSFVYTIFRQFIQELPIDAHAAEMAKGVVDPRDVVYYLLFTAFFLFLTFQALETRKWRA
jgi:ABC-2 type transport system permease protein